MNSVSNPASRNASKDTNVTKLLCFFAFWFGAVFATPLFIAAHNPVDLALSLNSVVVGSAVASLLLTFTCYGLGLIAGQTVSRWLPRIMLALAFLIAVQGNFVHDQFNYGSFNGEEVNLREYGWRFHAEWLGYFLFFGALVWALGRMRRIPAWLPLLPITSFLLLMASISDINTAASAGTEEVDEISPAVFNFSTLSNLIHLMPDGMQGGVVREVFEENPSLAAEYEGFTLFTNHLGLYQGTAPSLFTILTGKPFELEKGHKARRVKPEIDRLAYPKRLLEKGFQLDFVPIGPYVCPEYVSSCHTRSFNSMRPRGYFRHQNDEERQSIMLLADLSLFRLVPMLVKEKIYNDGHWFISDTTTDGTSPWPDPVIREWIEHMNLIDDRPVYKWYHFIGTHIPPHWDENCDYVKETPRDRESYKAQAFCVLSGISNLLNKLKAEGIYDQTAIIISSDHGHNTVSIDLTSPPLNGGLYPGLLGSARPTLLIKPMHDRHALAYSSAPTSLVDVAPTALSLAGIEPEQPDAMDFEDVEHRERYFTPYFIPKLWSGDPVPYVRYRVDGPVNDGSQWVLTEIEPFDKAPAFFDPVNFNTADRFMIGASLNKLAPDSKSSWVSGHQLGFLLYLDVPEEAAALQLTLHLPDWIPAQQLDLSVNDVLMGDSAVVRHTKDYWQHVEISLNPEALVEGNNFFDLRFRETYPSPDHDNWRTAGAVGSIRVISSDGKIAKPSVSLNSAGKD